ncbi:unnamed protein product, partial [Ectocarpus sp. 4 AP-2014]
GAGLDGNEADWSTTAGGGAAFDSGGAGRVEISDGSSSGSGSEVDVSDGDDDDDDTDVGFMDGGFADSDSFYAGGGGLQSSSLQAHAHAAAAAAGLSSFDTDGIDLAVGYADTAAAIDSRSGNPAAAAAAAPATAGGDDHRGGPKKLLVRGRSARRFWASRGGVPPRLELLPSHSHGHDGALADVDESSADEGTAVAGRHDSPRVRRRKSGDASSPGMEEPVGTRASGDGTASEAPEAGAAAASTEPGVAADITAAAAAAGDDGGGDNDGDKNASAAAHRQVGSGRWDEHLQAVTRAAWLGSKQASSRGFNSNASSVSAASASNAPTTPIAAATAAAGAAQSSAGGASGASKRFFPPHKSGGGDSCFSARSSRVLGDVDGREGAPAGALPISPPRSPPPAAAAASPDADFGGDGITGAGTPGGSSRPEGGSDDHKTRATATAAADERVAGSGFLYRVVFDGLNVLITLKLRDSILLLVQSGLEVALANLPGLFKPSEALLAKEREGEVLPGELRKRTSLDLKQFTDKPLALPGRKRDSGSLGSVTPYSKAERQSEDSVYSLTAGAGGSGGATRVGAGVQASPSIREGEGGPAMHKLFSIELRRTQIQLLGSETARATLLFSMEQGVIQGWVGLDPVEEGIVAARLNQGDVVESCRLQCLAQRLLTTFREAVTVGLEGTMLSAAPT